MASAAKIVKMREAHKAAPDLEPELKEFIDECLVPLLVRDALKTIAQEKPVAQARSIVAHSTPSALHSAEEMA